jgi:hypothetical protein
MSRASKQLATATTFFALFLGLVTTIGASTVRQVGFDELVARSEIVFHGRVTGVESFTNQNRQSVYTEIEFQVLETIVGSHQDSFLRLTFPVGSKDGLEVVIHGLKIPALGQEGVYFVESTEQSMVNPFYGWKQGQFIVTRDTEKNNPRVLTADGNPITSVSPAPTPSSISISNGAALGVESAPGGSVSTAMVLEDFRQIILATAERTR